MELIVELFSRSGRLKERVRVGGEQITIGRGYGNQIIVSDQYVCPVHVRMEFDAGERHWRLYDVSSRNGTFLVGNGRVDQPHVIRSGDEFELGRTRIRVVSPDHEVAETKVMPSGRVLADYFALSVVAVALLIITMATFALNQYLSLGTEADWKESVLEGLLVLSLPFVWACIWALIGRVSVHDARFAFHLSMGSLVILTGFVLAVAMEYLRFGFNSSAAITWLENLIEGAVLVVILLATLWMSTNLNRFKRWMVANCITWGLIGFALFYDYARLDDYDREYQWYLLKPPMAQMTKSLPFTDFVASLDELAEATEENLKEESSESLQ